MSDGNICESCYVKLKSAFFGQAITKYDCLICKEGFYSGSLHIPGYCCPTCSEKLSVCGECGSTAVMGPDRKRMVDFGNP